MVDIVDERSGRRQEERNQNPLFCAYDVIVVSLEPRWLQGGFSTLVGLFNRVGLKSNIGNTVVMFCHSF